MTDSGRTFRRPHRRRGLVRHRRGLSLAGEVPGQELRHPRGARLHRRHLGSVSLSRHPLRLATCTRSAIRSSRGRSRRRSPTGRGFSITFARRRPTTASTSTSASTIASSARRGRRRMRAGRWRPNAPRARARPRWCASPAVSCSCARAITNTRKATRRSFRARPTSPARSCIRRSGLRISTMPASAWW